MAKIGSIGEKLFSLWCSEADITCNPSTEDSAGWDFKLDFPIDEARELRSIHKSSPHCLIQVKTTAKHTRSVKIKLSNAFRYATVLEPVFIALIQVDKKNRPVRLFVKHVDQDLIARILERVAKEDNRKEFKLHRRKFNITFAANCEVSPIDGSSLCHDLLGKITDDIQSYMTRKRQILQKVGTSNRSSLLTFSSIGEESLTGLIEMSIGLRDSARISDIKVSETRFGLPIQPLPSRSSSALLSMPDRKPNASGTFRIFPNKFESFIEFQADLSISPFIDAAQDTTIVAKHDAGPLTLLINKRFSRATFNLNFDYERELSFIEIVKYGRLLSLLANSDNKPVFELLIDGKRAWISEFSVGAEFSNRYSWMSSDAELIRKTKSIFDYFEIDQSTFISMASINEARTQLTQYDAIVTGRSTVFKVIFDVPEDTEIKTEEARYITRLAFRIGRLGFGLVVSLRNQLERDANDDVIMCSKRLSIESKHVTMLPDESFVYSLSELASEIAANAASDEYVIIDTDCDPRSA